MFEQMWCWKCGQLLKELILPMSRREECAACGADQHVCKMCQYYQLVNTAACTEDRAERVSDKERANFCDYFSPNANANVNANANAFQGGYISSEEQARRELAALFGDDIEDSSEQGRSEKPLSEAGVSLAELEKLFTRDVENKD